MDAWAARALLSALTPPLVADELAGLYHIAGLYSNPCVYVYYYLVILLEIRFPLAA
jgi:hypothetical protein